VGGETTRWRRANDLGGRRDVSGAGGSGGGRTGLTCKKTADGAVQH
jgi:hypothetical protein